MTLARQQGLITQNHFFFFFLLLSGGYVPARPRGGICRQLHQVACRHGHFQLSETTGHEG